jgi:hypothetical protein
VQSLGNGTAFRSGAFAAARATPINPKYSGAVFRLFPRPRIPGHLTSCRLVSSAPHLGVLLTLSTSPSSVAHLLHTAR